VLPVLCTLQCHPEAARLGEEHINAILKDPEFGVNPTTHEHNIYKATIKYVPVLLCGQVGD
jgi:hypothetical protein